MTSVDVAKLYWKQIREGNKVKCHICGKDIDASDCLDLEYVKTKQRENLFMHKECFNTLLK